MFVRVEEAGIQPGDILCMMSEPQKGLIPQTVAMIDKLADRGVYRCNLNLKQDLYQSTTSQA